MAPLPADAPVLRWQSRQWHRLTMSGSPDMFARSDPQWHSASLFICNLLCIDVHDGSARFRHAFSDVLGCPDHARLRLKSQAKSTLQVARGAELENFAHEFRR